MYTITLLVPCIGATLNIRYNDIHNTINAYTMNTTKKNDVNFILDIYE